MNSRTAAVTGSFLHNLLEQAEQAGFDGMASDAARVDFLLKKMIAKSGLESNGVGPKITAMFATVGCPAPVGAEAHV